MSKTDLLHNGIGNTLALVERRDAYPLRKSQHQGTVDVFCGLAHARVDTRETAAMKKDELGVVLDALPAMLWTALPDGRIDFVNRRWSEYTGLSLDEGPGWEWQAVVNPDDLPKLLERWRSIVASGQSGEVEARVRRFDGKYRRFLVRCSPMCDDAGGIIKWCGVSTDVEDFRQAEEVLRRRDLDFQLIVDSIPVPVAVTTPSGQVECLNQLTLDYFGRAFDELKGWKTSEVVHPDDLQRTVALYEEAHHLGRAYNVESRHRGADGVYRWYNVRGFPLKDPQGRILRWLHLLIDIDDRKRAEEELRRSEAFLAEGQHLARMGNFSWHIGTGEIIWSEPLYRIFEFEPSTPVTLDLIASRVHPEDLPLMGDMIERAQRGDSDFEYQHRIRMPDHSIKYLHLIAHRARGDPGQMEYIGAILDITQRRLADEALSEARSELARVARATSLGAMTASIAHEVNQPLSGIIANAGTCLRMLASDAPNIDGARETARRTIRDGNRAADVIARLRTLFSRRAPTIEPVDLHEAAREVIALLSSDLQRAGVVLRTELADGLPPVGGDRIQLQQVIMNLLRNAADAMSGVDNRPRLLVIRTESDEEDNVRVSVQDAGIGFGLEGEERVFEAFYTTKSEGMGIGLSVSRSIIESHNGRLWAATNDGPGVTFSFFIPRYSTG
jgi:PAS domain S-box-containing protein